MFSLSWGPCSQRLVPPSSFSPLELPLPNLIQFLNFQSSMARYFGGYQQTLSVLQRFSFYWEPKQTITILNLQCGDGTLARVLMQWGKKRKFDLRIIAADPDHRLIQIAKDHKGRHNDIYYETKDFLDASFLQAQQVDYVVNGLSIHQYEESKAILFLKKVNLLSKRGFVVFDSVRDLRRWWLLKMLLGMKNNEELKQEILKSIEQSFSAREMHILLTGARLDAAQVTCPWGVWSVIQSERAWVGAAAVNAIPDFIGT